MMAEQPFRAISPTWVPLRAHCEDCGAVVRPEQRKCSTCSHLEQMAIRKPDVDDWMDAAFLAAWKELGG